MENFVWLAIFDIGKQCKIDYMQEFNEHLKTKNSKVWLPNDFNYWKYNLAMCANFAYLYCAKKTSVFFAQFSTRMW